MDIQIPDSWLKEYLETKASAKEITKMLSLCGPTVDRYKKKNGDIIYDIEITTNRVDSASIYGIAREAAAILPRFGKKAKLKPLILDKIKSNKNLGIKIVNNPKLCKRILAVKLEGIKVGSSPEWMKKRLLSVGQRPLNNIIDITNYIMWEVGHPIHVFDYDKLEKKKIVVREAKKGERLVSLDDKEHTMVGGEVVFGDGTGKIVDLPGIMGTKNSVVDRNTKNILLWIESIDPKKIRETSMSHAIRTQAAVLNEKSVDSELGLTAILRAVKLYKELAGAKVASKLVDIKEKRVVKNKVRLSKDFIDKRMGIILKKNEISSYLKPLEFKPVWKGNSLTVEVPTFRAVDVTIPEDIVEEIARIYGYHNLPSEIMTGPIPKPLQDASFDLEMKIKHSLKGSGGVEIYSLSLVPKEYMMKKGLALKNPLGNDSKYLRTSLMFSLINAAKNNAQEKDPFYLFEMANVYLPKKGTLPEEKLMVAGIFKGYVYRKAKGVVESLLKELRIKSTENAVDMKYFAPSKRVEFKSGSKNLGQFGLLEDEQYIYFEFDFESLRSSQEDLKYIPIPKYPPQIEDITLILPKKTKIAAIVEKIKNQNKITDAKYMDTFREASTFRVWYQDSAKTLTNEEVKEIRNRMLSVLTKSFGTQISR